MTGVFGDLRVLDLSWGIAGPMTTMMLADNGADGDPDRTSRRRSVPPVNPDTGSGSGASAAPASTCARIDGRDGLRRLLDGADVVVDSFSPGTMARLGLDHAELRRGQPAADHLLDHRLRRSPANTGTGPATTDWSRPAPACSTTRRAAGARRWSTSTGARARTPSSTRPKGWCGAPTGPGPSSPARRGPASEPPTRPRSGIAAALRAREVTGVGQRVRPRCSRARWPRSALNWQRVENPDAPLYWMWPIDSRSIEGLFECADGRWVHHWTVRPRLGLRLGGAGRAAAP